MNDVISHYELLIDENNDPVRDPAPLKEYMDKWDGQQFIDELKLSKEMSVLEIGIGTGRLAVRVAPLCRVFFGIDISPNTIERAKENLKNNSNVSLICGDFLKYNFDRKFNVIYSSLTFMHIEYKQTAINKVKALLSNGGLFLLSIDKNQSNAIDYGTRKIKIYPDVPENIKNCILKSKLTLIKHYETEFAHIFACKNETQQK